MDIDEGLQKLIFSAYIISCLFFFYLLFGNGLTELSLLQLSYPYQAVVSVPGWAVFAVSFAFFLVTATTTDIQEFKEVGTFFALLTAVSWWIINFQAFLKQPSLEREQAAIIWTFAVAAAVFLFLGVWWHRLMGLLNRLLNR